MCSSGVPLVLSWFIDRNIFWEVASALHCVVQTTEWHALAACCWPRHKFKCANYACKALITQPSVNHVSARLAMKHADLHRDLQRVEN